MLKKLFYSIMRLYTTNSVWAYSAIMAKAIIIDYCVRIFEPKPTSIILLLLLLTNRMSTGSDMSHIGHPQSKIVRVRPVMILNKMYFIVSWI